MTETSCEYLSLNKQDVRSVRLQTETGAPLWRGQERTGEDRGHQSEDRDDSQRLNISTVFVLTKRCGKCLGIYKTVSFLEYIYV